jgi:hypothetical protein
VMDIQVITLSTLAAVDLNCYSPLLFKVPVRQRTTMDGPSLFLPSSCSVAWQSGPIWSSLL